MYKSAKQGWYKLLNQDKLILPTLESQSVMKSFKVQDERYLINQGITLYIATHNKTGKKYFGKTQRFFNEEELQRKYHGSGSYWKKHLKKHGDDVTMKIFKVCSLNENDKDYVKPIALKFSEENDIVNSKEWANLIVENGLDGNSKGELHPMFGKNHSKETKIKIGEVNKGKYFSEETRLKLSISIKNTIKLNGGRFGENNPMFGKKHSEETKEKIRLKSSNKKQETKQNMRNSAKNKPQTSEETKLKISKANLGKKRDEETKKKMGELQKNKPRVECPHCKKIGAQNNMTRWHFNNCKDVK